MPNRWKNHKRKWTPEYEKQWMKEYRQKNRAKAYAASKAWAKAHPERDRENNQRERDSLKLKVLSFYGLNGVAKCVMCGFDNIHALCLDHIADNGADERRAYSMKRTSAGGQFYRWIKKQGFKPGYQTLCYNCNMIKEVNRRRKHAGANNSSPISSKELPDTSIREFRPGN